MLDLKGLSEPPNTLRKYNITTNRKRQQAAQPIVRLCIRSADFSVLIVAMNIKMIVLTRIPKVTAVYYKLNLQVIPPIAKPSESVINPSIK